MPQFNEISWLFFSLKFILIILLLTVIINFSYYNMSKVFVNMSKFSYLLLV